MLQIFLGSDTSCCDLLRPRLPRISQREEPPGVWFIVDSSRVGYDGGQNVREEWRVDQEQESHQRSFIKELIPARRPSREQVLRGIRYAVVVVGATLAALLFLYVLSLLFHITLWNVLKVLAVPITVGAAVPSLNWLQKKRELEIAEQRAKVDRDLAETRAYDDALQAYLDHMSELLANKDRPLRRAEPSEDLSTLARARTVTALSRLDSSRRGYVVQFLSEAGLINKDRVVIDLSGVSLIGANLSGTSLSRTNLSGAILYEANLTEADLSEADLSFTHLAEANLSGAHLEGANLAFADLTGLDLLPLAVSNSEPISAVFGLGLFTEVSDLLSKLTETDNDQALDALADLPTDKAEELRFFLDILQNANERLARQTGHLKGATMPSGEQYEEWLKSRGEENSGSS